MLANGALVLSALAAATAVLLGLGSGPAARWARTALAVAAAALVAATIRLAVAFAQSDFAFAYVVDHSRRGVSMPYRIAGLWGGLGGSLLLWVALLAVVAAVALRRPTEHAVAGAIVAPTALVVLAIVNPFERLDLPAFVGSGLTPILEHPAMVYHPPLLYLGLVATVVPFAQVVAGSVATRRSIFAAWGLLTAGLATGANWAYVELGWGGYWAWDPVENSALVPWLVLVGALHWSQRRGHRGAGSPADRVAVSLATAPFVLVLFGAVLTRSGATASVHAFGQQRAVGFGLGAVTALALLLAAWRVRSNPPAAPRVSARARWLAGATIGAVVAAVIVLVGTAQPIVWDWLGGTNRIVEGQFFAQLLAPIAVAALFAASFAPNQPHSIVTTVLGAGFGLGVGAFAGTLDASLGGVASAALFAGVGAVVVSMMFVGLRPGVSRARVAMVLGHFGIGILLFGVAGTIGASERAIRLEPGESVEVRGHTFTHIGVRAEARDDLLGGVVFADIEVDGRLFSPSLVSYPDAGVLLAETSLRSTPVADVQVVVRNASDSGWADYDLAVRPLAMWVWWGSAVLVLTALAGVVSLRLSDDTSAAGPQNRTESAGSAPSGREL